MGNSRVWLFRVLVLAAAGLMLLSWYMPWWSCDIEALFVEDAAIIHPYGLEVDSIILGLLGDWAEMPGFFTPLMWVYLGLAIAAILIGAWIKDKSIGLFGRKFSLSKLIIGIAGFSYILVVVLAVVVAAMRTGEVDLPLLGRTLVTMGTEGASWVSARLLFGYWLACGVGPLLIVLALLRDRIIGKAELTTK